MIFAILNILFQNLSFQGLWRAPRGGSKPFLGESTNPRDNSPHASNKMSVRGCEICGGSLDPNARGINGKRESKNWKIEVVSLRNYFNYFNYFSSPE